MLQPSVLPPAGAAATQHTAAPRARVCARWEISLRISAATPGGDELLWGKNGLLNFECLKFEDN